MFKRYKLQPKKHRPLELRTRRVGVAKRVADKTAKTLAMLKNASSSVRIRGAREAGQLEGVAEDTVKELAKMSCSEKKEVRSVFYAVAGKLLAKALPSETKAWEDVLFLYLESMKTCTAADVRRDALRLLDLLARHFSKRIAAQKEELVRWLENDHRVVSAESAHQTWKKDIEKRIGALKSMKKTEHTKAAHTDTVLLLHSCAVVRQTQGHGFAM